MSFPHGIVPTYDRVHPTPLYELGSSLVIGAYLWVRGGKNRPTGVILAEYLILTGTARFLVEFLRRNPHVLWGLTNAQLASLGSVVAGVLLLLFVSRRRTAEVASVHQSVAADPTA
jgi:phosphatidylglycerol:prolipoprotein diacylglycerol transferase